MGRIAIAIWVIVLWLCFPAAAREHYPGQYAQVDPATRDWFRSQKVPGGPTKGNLCCSVADGVYAEEDIIDGQYWARWRVDGGILTAWQPVPPETVLPKNYNGSPVVWFFYSNGIPVIRCYAPGAGL